MKSRKLHVRHEGGEYRQKFERVHPVLAQGKRMSGSLNSFISKGMKDKSLLKAKM